jgi:hypothetical protein
MSPADNPYGPGESYDSSRISSPFGPGMNATADPGYMASLGRGHPLAVMRLMALTFVAAPLLITIVVVLTVPITEALGTNTVLTGVAMAAPVVFALVAVMVAARFPRALDPMAAPDESGARAVAAFRQGVMSRFVFAEAPVLVGLAMCYVVSNPLPYAVGLVVGMPLLIWMVLPTRGMIERARRRLERAGAVSHLWTGLLDESAPDLH